MIVTMARTTELDACGAGLSVDGISAASAAVDRAQIKATAIKNRFNGVSSKFKDARVLVSKTGLVRIANFLQAAATEINIPRVAKALSLTWKGA